MNLICKENVQGELTNFVVNAENGYDIAILANEETGDIACVRIYDPRFKNQFVTPGTMWNLMALTQHVLHLKGVEKQGFSPIKINPLGNGKVELEIDHFHHHICPDHSIAEKLQAVVPEETSAFKYAIDALANYIIEKEYAA